LQEAIVLASVIGTDTRSKRFCRIPHPAACASTYDFAVIRKVATADYGPDWIVKFRRSDCATAHKAESELGKNATKIVRRTSCSWIILAVELCGSKVRNSYIEGIADNLFRLVCRWRLDKLQKSVQGKSIKRINFHFRSSVQ
jgi:hypothetical protein